MPPSLTEHSSYRALVVDDEADARRAARAVLESLGLVNITDVAGGHEALTAVNQQGAAYDLILCDLRMPEFDGVETMRALAALGVESGIVIMSSAGDSIVETAAVLGEMLGLRVLGSVSKPLAGHMIEPLLAQLRHVAAPRSGEQVVAPTQDIRNAFVRRELKLHYQPKVLMSTGELAGVEALVRWEHPMLGLLQPSAFVPLMEESDAFSAQLDEFTVREAIACAGRWRAEGRDLGVAINVSSRAFDRADFAERVEEYCRAAHLPVERVTLEVTETQLARDARRMKDAGARLRDRGISLSVDDFGTGLLNQAKLLELPFNELKIDRQFVDGCAVSESQRQVVESSIALAKRLKMTAVAKGIQNRAEWDLLQELGCDMVQGFSIARPMSEQSLEAWAVEWMSPVSS
jgi:EAL domain-containing protein (putative c-di-GMP-specific phosphodiesterase class I)/AmiR/NasT family two-component response regulator